MINTRRAYRTDALGLAILAERTFRDTFGEQNTAENIDLHCARSYSDAVQLAEITAAGMTTFVSESGQQLIGFAQIRWDNAGDGVVANSPAEIQRLYVAKEWHGRGAAQQLMDACLREMNARGCDVAWLGVWERNPRAISFYRKFGFNEVGAHIFPLGNDPQRDVIMARPVM